MCGNLFFSLIFSGHLIFKYNLILYSLKNIEERSFHSYLLENKSYSPLLSFTDMRASIISIQNIYIIVFLLKV